MKVIPQIMALDFSKDLEKKRGNFWLTDVLLNRVRMQ
jgi:hypothetical protein